MKNIHKHTAIVKASDIRHHNKWHAENLAERGNWQELERMHKAGRLSETFFRKTISAAKKSSKFASIRPL